MNSSLKMRSVYSTLHPFTGSIFVGNQMYCHFRVKSYQISFSTVTVSPHCKRRWANVKHTPLIWLISRINPVKSLLAPWTEWLANGTSSDFGILSETSRKFSSLDALSLSPRKTELSAVSLHSDSPLPGSTQSSDTLIGWEHLAAPTIPLSRSLLSLLYREAISNWSRMRTTSLNRMSKHFQSAPYLSQNKPSNTSKNIHTRKPRAKCTLFPRTHVENALSLWPQGSNPKVHSVDPPI